MDDVMLLPSDVARRWGVVPQTVRLLEINGKLKCERTARGVRLFRMSDVLKLEQERIEKGLRVSPVGV